MMAEWPNDGQLPHFTGSAFFDPGHDFSVVADVINVQDQAFPQQLPWPQASAQPQHPAPQEPHLSPAQPQPQVSYGRPQATTASTLDPSALTLDAFFNNNGGWRPPEPCNYCRRMRLQCFMLQTTAANPNPVSSCSACVALFRQCSLAERAKRHHSAFETSTPVIGQLHGVSEEDGAYLGAAPLSMTEQVQMQMQPMDDQDDDEFLVPPSQQASDLPKFSAKRTSARMVKRTRSLRNWFARHQEHPYPTDDEKANLAAESGLTRTQVTNWFTNARRRQRQSSRTASKQSYFPQGSPMPQISPSQLSPLERWRHSPPEQEAVDPAALQHALDGLDRSQSGANNGAFSLNRQSAEAHDLSSCSVSQASSYNGTNGYTWMEGSSNSGSSVAFSQKSTEALGLRSPADGYSSGEASQRGAVVQHLSNSGFLQCTFCKRTFKKKSDWVRHERTIHLPELDTWICCSQDHDLSRSHLAWQVGQTKPCCAYCGEEDPSAEHTRSHEFESCAERPVSERSFARKDHLWQHLQKFHGCTRWSGFALDLSQMQKSNDSVRSQCGFCGMKMESWKLRAQHIAAHFRSGLTMHNWSGDAGVGHIEGNDSKAATGKGT